VKAADTGQTPIEVRKRGERAKQDLVTLARNERRHAQETHCATRRASRQRHRIGARFHHNHPMPLDPVVDGERVGGRAAGDDHQADRRERAALAGFERRGLDGIKSGFRRERMMNQRDKPQACGFALDLAWQSPQRQPVGKYGRATIPASTLAACSRATDVGNGKL
jgi:hypothetical protein